MSLSSGEAELGALTTGAQESMAIANVLRELGLGSQIVLHTDSKATYGSAHRRGVGKFKHLALKDMWVKDAVAKKQFEVTHCEGITNEADVLTKPVTGIRLRELAGCLGMDLSQTLGNQHASWRSSTRDKCEEEEESEEAAFLGMLGQSGCGSGCRLELRLPGEQLLDAQLSRARVWGRIDAARLRQRTCLQEMRQIEEYIVVCQILLHWIEQRIIALEQEQRERRRDQEVQTMPVGIRPSWADCGCNACLTTWMQAGVEEREGDENVSHVLIVEENESANLVAQPLMSDSEFMTIVTVGAWILLCVFCCGVVCAGYSYSIVSRCCRWWTRFRNEPWNWTHSSWSTSSTVRERGRAAYEIHKSQ